MDLSVTVGCFGKQRHCSRIEIYFSLLSTVIIAFAEQEAKEEVEDMFVDETQVIDEENTGSIAKEEERFSKRRPVGDGTAKPRAKKNNFVRLNMRKKMFVRGQMSASGKKTKESCG
ncbi:hypothetical protein QR680_019158 [Steinernema hermaphroditum]|uniref:Uncharacterized protein n=1 Tax=Steinernema hermaphroditum TaxID=289476 RepID=A0AA39HMB9_9BILA|nr:hypothetical protein QR680_019158 [Steinernema hermaphroditum]